ncbi:hypothetical protein [Gaopeijia maritima]|uniref:Uncharacterized protein n=1 Tax=Gaopeijia maritima TaxID=3119007 RepID=A0ABU9ECN4_9BACT
MSLGIPGISNFPGGLGPLGTPARSGRSSDAAVPRPDTQVESARTEMSREAPGASDVPPGTDPELWAVLTTEERSHFARLRSMGPLTYNTASSAGPQQPTQARRGVRLDVRV